ncbi:MAG: glycosyltransferase family 39 protein [Planctomycetota bacterium]
MNDKPMRKRRILLLLIFLLAVALRVAWALAQPPDLNYPDSVGYDMVARNFLATGDLVQGESTKISRVPVYPLYLSACYKLFGEGNYVFPRVIQAVLGSVLCLVVYELARPLLGARVALLAALGAAVYPFFIFYSALLLTETFFTLALAIFLWLILSLERLPDQPLLAKAAVAGLLAGATVLLKPSFLLFLPFLAALWLLVSKRPARALGALLAIALCTAFVMTPWVVRNWTLTERFVPTTLTVGISLYEGVHPMADGGPSMDRMPREVYGVSEYEQDRLYRQLAVDIIRTEPRRILTLAGVKFLRFWNVVPNSPAHQDFKYRLLSVASLVPILCFACIGVVKAPLPVGQRLLLLSPAIYFTLLHMLFVSSIRYRDPVMPFVIIFAAGGLLMLLGARPQDDLALEARERDLARAGDPG